MSGPAPKPAATRQRRNRSSSAARLDTIESAAENVVPSLPPRAVTDGPWHPMVVAWWDGAWRSPMASEWIRSDMLGGLYQLAMLHQDFWTADTQAKRLSASSEIRLQEVRFGLSPIDRRRLQWEIEKGEEAAERTAGRRQRKAPPTKAGADPRRVLKAI